MEKIKELKANYLSENQYVRKTTLDLNDLLKRRSDEKKNDNKKNILLIAGTFISAGIVFLLIIL